MNTPKLIVFAALILLFASCNPSRFGWSPDEGQSAGRQSTNMREDFDPLTLEDDDIVVKERVADDEREDQTQISGAVNEAGKAETVQPKMVPGFRVQLMSAKDEAQIIEEKKKAMMKFQQSIYVVFESPYYKIRLGDFLTHEDAARMQAAARRNGFPGAFIARCLIDRARAGQ